MIAGTSIYLNGEWVGSESNPRWCATTVNWFDINDNGRPTVNLLWTAKFRAQWERAINLQIIFACERNCVCEVVKEVELNAICIRQHTTAKARCRAAVYCLPGNYIFMQLTGWNSKGSRFTRCITYFWKQNWCLDMIWSAKLHNDPFYRILCAVTKLLLHPT